MAKILKGAPVAESIIEKAKRDIEELKQKGVIPKIALLRVGERPDDIAYEKSILKAAERATAEVKKVVLSDGVSKEEFYEALEDLNKDDGVCGILMFRPLPDYFDNELARRSLVTAKDIDGCTDGSLCGVFTGTKIGFPPCTAQAVMEILHYYGVEIQSKRAVVIGRSLVIGRPVAMMLMEENATVTICHTKTSNVAEVVREADIVIAAAGKLRSVTRDFVRPGQVVIDVGINWDDEKKAIAGDVDFDAAEPIVDAITPVPGGVGSVTTAVLIAQLVRAAKEKNG